MHRWSLVAILALAACSADPPSEVPATFTGPSSAEIFLHNATVEPLVYAAAGEGTLALLDIRPRLERGEYEDRLVASGATVPVTDIIGYDPALGVTFYLYVVDSLSRAAHYEGFFLASAQELARNEGVVTIGAGRP